ncbi:hypothetical protein GURASL_25220 [Geotalea uraniireducens]|uniref:RNA polymerase sigma factor n=1 Tax=Geotalea uraniireducens TaxID=351604 RepID=A0ABM8EMR6_9BACT|nr:RNA polymerase sigma factor [Geotalea uraniireducens]BDV43599.1 hypothetical protein GURASL_25220 [Geotalea uraniireducens]
MRSVDVVGDETGDHEIISGILAGRPDDFALLLARYRGYVFKIVSGNVPPEAVEDLAHEVFVDAYRSLAGFDVRTSFKKWLAGIAVHRCYDYWRERYRNREVPMSALTEDHLAWVDGVLADRARGAFAGAEMRREAREVLQWALAGLSAEDRMVLTLVHLEGLPVKEAAALLGWSVISVKVRAHRSREKMRRRIVAMLEEGG